MSADPAWRVCVCRIGHLSRGWAPACSNVSASVAAAMLQGQCLPRLFRCVQCTHACALALVQAGVCTHACSLVRSGS